VSHYGNGGGSKKEDLFSFLDFSKEHPVVSSPGGEVVFFDPGFGFIRVSSPGPSPESSVCLMIYEAECLLATDVPMVWLHSKIGSESVSRHAPFLVFLPALPPRSASEDDVHAC
jgi:hypothetical protein